MLCVVDSNVLFTYFWKNALLKEFLAREKVKLTAPAYALYEIEKYKKEICEKAKITNQEFNIIKRELEGLVRFIALEEYVSFFHEVKKLGKSLSEEQALGLLNDADFLALALQLKIPLWSNDRLLKEQKVVTVLNSREMVELLADEIV